LVPARPVPGLRSLRWSGSLHERLRFSFAFSPPALRRHDGGALGKAPARACHASRWKLLAMPVHWEPQHGTRRWVTCESGLTAAMRSHQQELSPCGPMVCAAAPGRTAAGLLEGHGSARACPAKIPAVACRRCSAVAVRAAGSRAKCCCSINGGSAQWQRGLAFVCALGRPSLDSRLHAMSCA